MIISIALSRGALTYLTDRRLILSPPACALHFSKTGWVTDPKTGHKPANGVVMQTTACNGHNCCCCCCYYWLAKCWLSVSIHRVWQAATQAAQTGQLYEKQTLGCCRLLYLCHLRLSNSVPSRFLLDTIYVQGQIKNQPPKIQKTQTKVSKLIQNFLRQLGNTRGFIQRRNNSCNAVRRSSEWRNRVRGRVWMANQTGLVFQMAFPSHK